MGKLAGLVMIAAGVGTAAYVYPMFGTGGDRADRQLADVVAITTGAVPAPQPTRPPTVIVKQAGAPETQRVVSAETAPGKLPLATPAPKAPIAAIASAPVIETPNAKPIDVPQPAVAKRPTKGDDEGKLALTRDIQRELKRVGCFEGTVDGAWTPETRQAMKSFIDRVNATLPVEDPDHILKTLVQGHPGNACGKSCPTGQALNADGKCLPTAIIAQAPKRQPAPQRDAASAPAPRASSWEPKVVPAPEVAVKPDAKPAVNQPAVAALPEPKPEPRPVVKSEPLPGRAALGASNVTPPSPPTAPVTEEAPKPKRPVITVKPRETSTGETRAAAVPPPSNLPSSNAAPAMGAVAAAVDTQPRKPKPPVVEETEKPRARIAPPPAPVVRAPPPQRVVTYTPTYSSPTFRERPRFGPQIFRELERHGR